MNKRFTLILSLVMMTSLLFSGALMAQDDDLDDFFVSEDGSVAFDFPSTWTAEEANGAISVTSPDGDELFMLPPLVAAEILDLDATTPEAAAFELNEANGEGEEIDPKPVMIGAYEGVAFEAIGNFIIVIFDTGEGLFFVQMSIIIQPIPPEIENTLFAILETVDYVAPDVDMTSDDDEDIVERDERLDADFVEVGGSYMIGYPSDWVVVEESDFGLVQFGQTEDDESPVIVVSASGLEALELNPDDGAETVLQNILDIEGAEADIDPITVGEFEGAQIYVADETDEFYVVALDTDRGVFAFQAGSLGFLDAEEIEIFFAMLETFSFDVSNAMTNETVEPIAQWAYDAEATSEYSSPEWSAMQATGEPDTDACGDEVTAWASSSSNGVDSLTVYYDISVVPSQINIYQTYNPGSITSVELISIAGEIITLEASSDPPGNTECPGIFTVDIEGVSDPVYAVTINFDQSIGGGWNEIDAVELIGTP